MSSMIYLGLDVHKDSITVAVLPAGAPAPTRVERLPNDLLKVRRFCERLAAQGELRACYEASGAGYVIHRAMREWGYACEVIAPSLIPSKPGQQRKHDKHDAAQLARLYRAGADDYVYGPPHHRSTNPWCVGWSGSWRRRPARGQRYEQQDPDGCASTHEPPRAAGRG